MESPLIKFGYVNASTKNNILTAQCLFCTNKTLLSDKFGTFVLSYGTWTWTWLLLDLLQVWEKVWLNKHQNYYNYCCCCWYGTGGSSSTMVVAAAAVVVEW